MALIDDLPTETKDKIISMYADGYGSTIIGRALGFSSSRVLYILRKLDIDRRPPGRGRPQLSIPLPTDLLSMLDGHLLGDGAMFPVNNTHINSGFILTQSEKHRDFAVWTKEMFEESNIKVNVHIVQPSRAIQISSQKTKEFTQVRRRWYPDGKKTVPSDLRLTPLAMTCWYAGDGTLFPKGGITIYTNSFTFNECHFLRGLMMGTFGIRAKVRAHIPGENSWSKHPDVPVPTLYIPKSDIRILFDIIGQPPFKDLLYKWPNQ